MDLDVQNESVDLRKLRRYILGTQLSFFFEGQLTSKTKPFSIKARVIWGLGIYRYQYVSTLVFKNPIFWVVSIFT